MKLIIILLLFSFKSSAQVRVKGFGTLTTRTTEVLTPTGTAKVKALGTITTRTVTVDAQAIGMGGVQDSLRIAYMLINDLINEINLMKQDSTDFSKRDFKLNNGVIEIIR